MNYDPDLTNSGNMAIQTVELTFGSWLYRKTVTVEVGGNCTGLDVIRAAVCKFYYELDDHIVLTHGPDSLEIADDDDRGEDWLEDMLVGAKIVAIRPRD